MTKKNKLIQFILLRGLAREARHWRHFPEKLTLLGRKQGFECRIDCLDLPGTGRFSEMRSPLTIEEITDFVREKYADLRAQRRLDGEPIAESAHLVAISLGGMIAARWLQHWSHDFRSAILINTSFRGFSPFHKRLQFSAYRHFAEILRQRDARAREKAILQMVSNRPEIFDEVANEWAQIANTRPVSYENFARQLIAGSRFRAKLQPPKIPVLVLNSLRDHMVDPSCSEAIAHHWQTDLRRHSTAGHDIPLDAPDWLSEQVLAWCGENGWAAACTLSR